jgi:hypothetical protein
VGKVQRKSIHRIKSGISQIVGAASNVVCPGITQRGAAPARVPQAKKAAAAQEAINGIDCLWHINELRSRPILFSVRAQSSGDKSLQPAQRVRCGCGATAAEK